ncbi:MAG TPA: RMD1 family protein [Chitinophagaceae bacterium]|nr:RMD1 family protein [Chitinophagaceae bacterium]
MTLNTVAYQVADSIDLKGFKASFPVEIFYEEPDEIFYEMPDQRLIYVFKYGVICFLNYDEIKIAEFFRLIEPFCRNVFDDKLSEVLQIETGTSENRFGYNKVELQQGKTNVLRIVMLNVSQSVALDYYSDQTNRLLLQTHHHTQQLEQKGKLGISGKNLTKFIGKTLNLKNKIAENLYVFDSPDVTWEDEYLYKVDMGVKNTFDLQVRFRNVEEGLVIVKENLELFKDILQHRKSTALEWIIIILILVEVINLVVEKLFTK